MNLNWLTRRNRFKNKPKAQTAKWQAPKFITEWRTYARRTAVIAIVIGGLVALTWALDRPIRVISMDGNFQRVSPGQIEKAGNFFLTALFFSTA